MPPPTAHPPAEALAAFALGKLDPADSAPVEEHLAGCEPCQDEVAAVPPDTLVAAVAAAHTLTVGRADGATPTFAAAATPSLGAGTQGWGGLAPGADDADVPPALAGHPKYRVVRRLGTGGMGTVWLAQHAVMHREVAVKVIRPDLLARPGAAGRFLREVRAAARLDHPNIVRAYDAEQAGDSCLLAMEYVAGDTLADLVAAGPMPVAEACRAVRDAARGLAHAHAAGLVHRDVKPHNLIRAADGTVKVLDFGLAGVGAGEVIAAGGEGLTGAGMVVGTPDYIAPEQVADPHAADARADVYGLGCTFYHLLAGRPAFPGGSIMEKLTAHETHTPDPIPGLAADLAAVLAKMLAKRPEDRYQTADEVVAALDAGTDSWRAAERARWLRRRALAVGAGLLAFVFLALGAVVYKIERDHEEVVISTDDPDVEVVMLRKGDLVRLRDPKSGQTWELNTLTKQLGLVDQPDGLTVSLPDREPFVLRRNGREVFRVTRLPRAVPAPAAGAALPFVIPAGGVRPDRQYPTLAEAVAAAVGGDTIELRGNGPFVAAPIAIQGKPLTLRAGAGFRPVVRLSPEGENASAPLLKTDAALVLEGLDLQYTGAGNKFRPTWPLIHSTAPLAAANCRFLMACERQALCLLADGCPAVELRNCELLMLGFNFAVTWNCPPDGRLAVENCVHLGRSLLNVDHRDNRPASVRLARNTVVGYGEVAVVTLATWPDADRARLGFAMTGNVTETDQLMTCTHDPDHTVEQVRALLPRFIRWQDRDNLYCARNALLAHYHVRQAVTEYLVPGRTIADWEGFWKLDKTGSTAADALRFEGGKGAKDFRAKLADGPEHLTPADFRLAEGSVAKGAAPAGADLDLVGPGAAYERWKQTPAYQAWRLAHAAPADTGVVVPRLVRTTDAGSPVRSLGYTPGGGTLVVGGDDLRLFDRLTGSQVHREPRPGNVTAAVALSADGKTAAAASQGTILVFDLDAGRRLREVPIQSKNAFTFSLALSHDGRTLAYSADGAVRLVDLATDRTDSIPAAQKGSPFGVGFSADGRYLVYTADEMVTILDAKTRAVVEKRHIGTVGLSATSGDGTRLVVTSGAGRPEFSAYPLPSGELYREGNVPAGIGALSLSADGRYLALGLVNGTAQVWDLRQKKLLASWDVRDPAQQKGPFSHTAVAITPDGRTLATGAANTFRVWDLTPGGAGDGWVPLFNTKDLTGWRPVGGTPATWRVENGGLRGAGSAGSLVSDRALGDFQFKAEVRLSPGASWALGFRSDPPADGKAGLTANFVYKGQTNDVAGHMRMETTLTRDGEQLAKFVGNVKPNDWFPVELTVRGDRATITVPDDGLGASGLRQPLPRGPVVLRLLDPNSVLEVRNLTVRELAPAAPAPQP